MIIPFYDINTTHTAYTIVYTAYYKYYLITSNTLNALVMVLYGIGEIFNYVGANIGTNNNKNSNNNNTHNDLLDQG